MAGMVDTPKRASKLTFRRPITNRTKLSSHAQAQTLKQ
ncbi:hypothetical protein NBRC111894_2709 [Sporolactobacillus inulinus]|uniref:Uncharacterized protein n=1 Tax=Sporolactobacillus inulinus TaxID=2078 RepID=A0A4Y1ZDL3_9BACL|nr:hypothetical protein NBRC111894_2709 [Sporolactobacillus inulinus]